MAEYSEDLPQEAPEDGEEISIGEESAEEPEPVIDDNDDNLCFTLRQSKKGKAILKQFVDKVFLEFEMDWDSAEAHRERRAADWRLFAGDIPKKDWPFEHCANGHIPILLENTIRLHSRLMGEIFGEWESFARAVPFGPDDEQQADTVSLHTNYQLAWDTPGFRRQCDRSLLMTLVCGDTFAVSFRDEDRGENTHEVLTTDELAFPFVMTTTRSDMSDVPRRTRIIYRYRHQIQQRQGDWDVPDEVMGMAASDIEDDPAPTQRLSEGQTSLIEPAPDDPGRPHKILVYEGWDDGILPEQNRDRFVQIYVHYDTREILKLQVYEEEDWKDRLRFEGELAQMQAYQADLQIQEQEVVAGLSQAMFQMPGLTPEQMQMIAERMKEGRPLRVPPPTWADDPSDPEALPAPVKMSPVQPYTHMCALENLSGSLGIAPGAMQAEHNRAANTLFNQFIDQATLNNVPFGIASSMLAFGNDKQIEVKPGTILVVDAAPDDVAKGLQQYRPGPANPQLVEAMDKVIERAQASMQSPDVLSGEAGKSGETWRGIASRIEQAAKQLSVFGQKYAFEFLGQILKNNSRLNELYLPDYEIQHLFDWMLMMRREVPVAREMYARKYDWMLRADMRFATKAQRIGEADELVAMSGTMPELMMNGAFRHAVIAKALEARGRYDLVAKLGAPPDAPAQFPVMQPPAPPGAAPPGAA